VDHQACPSSETEGLWALSMSRYAKKTLTLLLRTALQLQYAQLRQVTAYQVLSKSLQKSI